MNMRGSENAGQASHVGMKGHTSQVSVTQNRTGTVRGNLAANAKGNHAGVALGEQKHGECAGLMHCARPVHMLRQAITHMVLMCR